MERRSAANSSAILRSLAAFRGIHLYCPTRVAGSTGIPEPLFVDGEPRFAVQEIEDGQDCGSADGAVYVSSDGLTG